MLQDTAKFAIDNLWQRAFRTARWGLGQCSNVMSIVQSAPWAVDPNLGTVCVKDHKAGLQVTPTYLGYHEPRKRKGGGESDLASIGIRRTPLSPFWARCRWQMRVLT
jgi:hypothetical protein